MPVTWNDRANVKLLIGIILISKPKLDINSLAEYMGPDCTVPALYSRIKKLKRAAIENGTTYSAGSALTRSKRKNGADEPIVLEDSAGELSAEEDSESPPKKMKSEDYKVKEEEEY